MARVSGVEVTEKRTLNLARRENIYKQLGSMRARYKELAGYASELTEKYLGPDVPPEVERWAFGYGGFVDQLIKEYRLTAVSETRNVISSSVRSGSLDMYHKLVEAGSDLSYSDYLKMRKKVVAATLERVLTEPWHGKTLGQRGYILERNAEVKVRDLIAKFYGKGPEVVAAVLQDFFGFGPRGKSPHGTVYKPLERLAITEGQRAYKESGLELMRLAGIQFVRRVLTPEHSAILAKYGMLRDECDDYAEADPYRLGPGVYRIADMGNIVPLVVHPHCFTAGTRIETSKGRVPISRVQVGDLVLTYKGRFKRVVRLSRRMVKNVDMVKLKTAHGRWGSSVEVLVTVNHPVLVEDKWIEAGELKVGDRLTVPADECPVCGKLKVKARKFCSRICMGKRHVVVMRKMYSDGRLDGAVVTRKAHEKCRELIAKGEFVFQRPGFYEMVNRRIASKHYGGTKIERRVGWLLKEMGISADPGHIVYRDEWVRCGKGWRRRFYKVDFALVDEMIAIECDGKQWHKDVEKDMERQGEIEDKGWTVLRFGEDRILNDLGSCADELGRVLANHAGVYKFCGEAITKIERFKWSGWVYNFAVEEDESYVAGGFVAHNCMCEDEPYVLDEKQMNEKLGLWKRELAKYDFSVENPGQRGWGIVDELGGDAHGYGSAEVSRLLDVDRDLAEKCMILFVEGETAAKRNWAARKLGLLVRFDKYMNKYYLTPKDTEWYERVKKGRVAWVGEEVPVWYQ